MAAPTRRKLLGTGILAALSAAAGSALGRPTVSAAAANLPPPLNWPPGLPYRPGPGPSLGRHTRPSPQAVREAEMLRLYRVSSPTEQAAIRRLMERTLAGHDMHAVGVECLLAFGWNEAEARERVAAALSADRTGARA